MLKTIMTFLRKPTRPQLYFLIALLYSNISIAGPKLFGPTPTTLTSIPILVQFSYDGNAANLVKDFSILPPLAPILSANAMIDTSVPLSNPSPNIWSFNISPVSIMTAGVLTVQIPGGFHREDGQMTTASQTLLISHGGLPAGVSLVQIDGGSNYYAANRLDYAAKAGWDNPEFFPIGPWTGYLLAQSDADIWKDVGWNTAFVLTGNSFISVAASNHISVIQSVEPGAGIMAGTGAETVGLQTWDEPGTYAEGVSDPLSSSANSLQDGRWWWVNNTWNWIEYGGLNGAPPPDTSASVLSELITTPNGTQRHIDLGTLDAYWFAGSSSGALTYQAGLIYNLGGNASADQVRRGFIYGDVIDTERGYQKTYPAPIFSYIENGGPYTQNTQASSYIQPPELNWAVWQSIIHGARGIMYFNNTFAGPGVNDDDIEGTYFQTVQQGQSVSIYQQTKATDALVAQLAPVINSPFALGYVSADPKSGEVPLPASANGVNAFSGIDVMAKYHKSKFYIFASTRVSEQQTNIAATFTIADPNANSVTVVNENRTIPIVKQQFTDQFANAWTIHIYKVN